MTLSEGRGVPLGMKKILVTAVLSVLLGTWGGILPASAAEAPKPSRTLIQPGLILTRGDDTGWNELGGGFSLRSFSYLDPASSDGLYFGFLGGAFTRVAGGIALADTRIVTLGWRGNPLGWFGKPAYGLQFDASLSPTIGARIKGTTILGGAYTGVGLTVGVAIPVLDGQDLGVSWEPVFPVTSWGGDPAPNRGYSDFVLTWTFKMRTETTNLPWNG